MVESELVVSLPIGATERARGALIKADWFACALLLLLGAVPTLVLWGKSTYLTGDSYQYLRAGLSWAQGQGFRDMSGEPFTVLAPLYPLLIGIAHLLFGSVNIELLARLIAFAGALVAVVSFYWLLRIHFSSLFAALAASLFSFMPSRVWIGLYALSEGLYIGLLMLGMAVFFRSKRLRSIAAAGGLLGLAYLTRPEALLYFTGLAIVAFLRPYQRWKMVSAFALGFIMIALPYHAWIYGVSGKLNSGRGDVLLSQSQAIYEGKMSSVLVFNRANADGTIESALASNPGVTQIGARYLAFTRIEFARLFHLLGPRTLVVVLLVSGIIILLVQTRLRRVNIRPADSWPIILASWLMLLPLFHIEDRYLIQVVPAFLFWLVLILAAIQKLLAGKLGARASLAGLVPIVVAALFMFSYGYRLVTQVPPGDASSLARNTARWCEEQHLSPATTVSQTPDFAFFSDSHHVWMANGDPENVLAYARRNGARYIYVSSHDVETPLNDVLLRDSAQLPHGLKLLHEESDGTERARLFQLN